MAVPKNENVRTITEIMGYYDLYAKKYTNIVKEYRSYVKKRAERKVKGPNIKESTLRELPEVPLFHLSRHEAVKYLESLDTADLHETRCAIEDAVESYSYVTIREMVKYFKYDEERARHPKSKFGIDPNKTLTKIRSSRKGKNSDEL